MLTRIYLANADAQTVASIGAGLGISGTVLGGAFGFTGQWGVEPTVIIELGNPAEGDVAALVAALFGAHPNEQAVYVDDGVSGQVWFRDGRVE